MRLPRPASAETGKRCWTSRKCAHVAGIPSAAAVCVQGADVPDNVPESCSQRAVNSLVGSADIRDNSYLSRIKFGTARVARHPATWTTSPSAVILMTMTTSMSLAEVKAHLSEVVNRVSGHHERVMVTVHGTPSAVLVAPEDLESLEETIAILADPAAMERMAASDAELAVGKGESESLLGAAMEHRHRRVGA